MEPGNELARRMVDAFGRLSVDEAIAMCAPDVELTTLLDQFGKPKLRGHEGLREWFERMTEIWAFLEIRDWEVEHHSDWILVTGTARGRGRGSPQELDMTWASAGKVADRRLAKLGIYLSRAEALAAIESE